MYLNVKYLGQSGETQTFLETECYVGNRIDKREKKNCW